MNKNEILTYSGFTIVILTGTDANGSTEAAIQCSLPTTDKDGIGRGGASWGNLKMEDATGGDPKTGSWESTASRLDSGGGGWVRF